MFRNFEIDAQSFYFHGYFGPELGYYECFILSLFTRIKQIKNHKHINTTDNTEEKQAKQQQYDSHKPNFPAFLSAHHLLARNEANQKAPGLAF